MYLDDLVNLLVLPLVRLGHVLSTRYHLVVALVGPPVAVWRRSEVRIVLGAMPLVVGACGIRLKVAGR
jgi:hypothetical protein